jgi:hypothetical protein
VLEVCRANLGREITEADFWAAVCALVTCAPDTARRRRDALQSQGLVGVERVALGVVCVRSVMAAGNEGGR